MKTILLATLSITLASCAGTPLASSDVRQKSYIIESKNDKAKNFSLSLAHLSKNVGDSNHAIKLQDKEDGTIIMKGLVTCNVFKQLGAPDMNLEFNLTVNSKDQKIRVFFEDLTMTGPGSQWEYAILNNASKVEQASKCLDGIIDGLKKELSTTTKSDW